MVKKKFNENSTLMGRMGFKDPDLKSPTHDDVIMWLYQEGTIKELCKNHILPIYIERSFNGHYDSYEEITEQKKNQFMRQVENYDFKCRIMKKIVEMNVINDKEYEIGYVDLCVVCSIHYPVFKINRGVNDRWNNDWEIVELNSNVGLIFEVKVQENITLGDLMRQLNMYKKYGRHSIYKNLNRSFMLDSHFRFVVTPRNNSLNKYSSVLKDQGWDFIEAPFEQQPNTKQGNRQESITNY